MTRRLAVIPARGGSKRIPGKNIRIFHNRPMISYILATTRASRLFDHIHVSTEDQEIAATVQELGFPVAFRRPAELADDVTPLMPVLRYVAKTFERGFCAFDEIWMLSACAPLIEVDDLRAASDFFASQHGGVYEGMPLLAVAAFPAPIEWAFDRKPSGRLLPLQPGAFSIRSQDLPTRYYDAGAFTVFPAGRILASEGAGADTGYRGFVIPRHKAVDIDTEEDWRLAEALFAAAN